MSINHYIVGDSQSESIYTCLHRKDKRKQKFVEYWRVIGVNGHHLLYTIPSGCQMKALQQTELKEKLLNCSHKQTAKATLIKPHGILFILHANPQQRDTCDIDSSAWRSFIYLYVLLVYLGKYCKEHSHKHTHRLISQPFLNDLIIVHLGICI